MSDLSENTELSKYKKELYKFYEQELRSVIQFAAPFACEGLSVSLLRKFGEELENLVKTELTKEHSKELESLAKKQNNV